jgi:hypothetical protein
MGGYAGYGEKPDRDACDSVDAQCAEPDAMSAKTKCQAPIRVVRIMSCILERDRSSSRADGVELKLLFLQVEAAVLK